MHSSQGQIYSQVFPHRIGALNGYSAYFAPVLKRTWFVWGSHRKPPRQGLGGSSRPLCFVCCHCTQLKNPYLRNYNWGQILSSATGEGVVYLCWGQEAVTEHQPGPWPQETCTRSIGTIFLYGPPQALGNTEAKGQGRGGTSFPQLKHELY